MSIKNSNDNIGDRTRDLPAFSAVSQPPRAPFTVKLEMKQEGQTDPYGVSIHLLCPSVRTETTTSQNLKPLFVKSSNGGVFENSSSLLNFCSNQLRVMMMMID